MALKHLALIFLCSLLLSSPHEIKARDSQMFNKIPSKTNEVEVEVKQPQQDLPNKEATDPKQEEEPNFIPQNTENNYGLYGHESGQFPPSTKTQNNNKYLPYNAKYLPKNYNTRAYVTQPEDFNENSYTNTPTNNYNNYQTQDNSNKYNNAQKSVLNNEFDSMDTQEDTSDNDNNNYFNDDVSNNNNNFNTRLVDVSETANNNNNNYFNTRFMDASETADNNYNNNYFNTRFTDASQTANSNNNNYFNTRFMDSSETTNNNNDNNNYFNTRFMGASETANNNNNNYFRSGKSRVNRAETEGMSDTRVMENGKYHYDINSGRYSRDHPYMNPMAMRNQYNPTGFNNIDSSYQYDNFNADQDQYQNEDNMP